MGTKARTSASVTGRPYARCARLFAISCAHGNSPLAFGSQIKIIGRDVLFDIGANIGVYSLIAAKKPGGGAHRPSMGQDMVKGRRTEIEFLNGFICDKAKDVGIATPANAALTDIVKRVEKGELKPDPKHLIDLRLN